MTQHVIECANTCTVTLVHEWNIPLLNLTVEQGLILGVATLSVWALAWGFLTLTRLFRDGGEE